MNYFKTKWLIGLLTLGLIISSTGAAWAAETEPETAGAQPRRVLRGQVTAIDGDVLTVQTTRGEITVLTDDETRFRIPGIDDASLADLHICDEVALGGVRQGSALRARLILVIPENATLLRGTVETIAEQSLTIAPSTSFAEHPERSERTGHRSGEDTVTVLADEHTRIFVPGVESPTLQDLTIGAPISVAGLQDESGNLIARVIRALLGHERGLVHGEVTAIEANTLHLNTRRGELSLQVDDETRFRIPGLEEPTLQDLSVGSQALVGWIKNEDGSLYARLVTTIPERPHQARITGQVASIAGDSLTLTLKSGNEISLLTDENTKFLVPGLTDATIADLNAGDVVSALGARPEGDETPLAAIVAVLRDAEGNPAGVRGELTAIDGLPDRSHGNTLSVTLNSGDEVSLLTDEHTQFFVSGVTDANIGDLNVGDTIIAQTVEQKDGTLHLYASAVGQGRERRRGAVRGEVTAIEGSAITIILSRHSPSAELRTGGEITVLTDERTRFHLPGVEDAGIDNLEIGQNIGAAGYWNEDGSLQANIVGARRND